VHRRLGQRAIANILNREGVRAEHGGAWTYMIVTSVLTSPKYVGDLVANRYSRRFSEKARRNDEATWVRVPNAFVGIVSRKLFAAAQRRIAERAPRRSRQSILAAAALLAAHGELTGDLVESSPDMSRGSIRWHFGGLAGLCAELGHPYAGPPPRRRQVRIAADEALRRLAALCEATGHLSTELINRAPNLPRSEVFRKRFGSLRTAYALVGFVPPSQSLMSSRVGVARVAAARASAERLWASLP
jgi:AcrR family transcriptional regulator